MDRAINILAQVAPAENTETTLFSVARDSHALIHQLSVCNRSGSPTTFRVSVSIRGAATQAADYLYYDLDLEGNDTFASEITVTLDPFDVIRIYTPSASLSFTLFGSKT